MNDYANHATKEIIVVLAGCIGYADTLKDLKFRNSDKAMQPLIEMQNHASKALEAVMDGLNQEQVEGLIRTANSLELKCVTKHNPEAKKDYYLCPMDAFDRLMGDVANACAFCDKQGKEVKRCERRKDLLACGVIPWGEKECPYQG